MSGLVPGKGVAHALLRAARRRDWTNARPFAKNSVAKVSTRGRWRSLEAHGVGESSFALIVFLEMHVLSIIFRGVSNVAALAQRTLSRSTPWPVWIEITHPPGVK
jgi:hypothetical protein